MKLIISKDKLQEGKLESKERKTIENVESFLINRTKKLKDDGLTWINCDLIIYRKYNSSLLGEHEYLYNGENLHVYEK